MISAVYCSQAGFIGLHLNRGATQGRCAAVGTSPSYRAVAFTSRDGGISWLAARLSPGTCLLRRSLRRFRAREETRTPGLLITSELLCL